MDLKKLASLAAVAALLLACSDDKKSVPSCDDLKAQIDKCNFTDAVKAQFPPFCASASEDCRACLDGKLCGNTESCDPQCKKT